MTLSSVFARIAVGGVVGAVLGLVVGLVVTALTSLDNPFWFVSIGIVVGAVAGGPLLGEPRRSRGRDPRP